MGPCEVRVDHSVKSAGPTDDALVAVNFNAPHVPEEYDGVGADALATCIVIEEVARARASSSRIQR